MCGNCFGHWANPSEPSEFMKLHKVFIFLNYCNRCCCCCCCSVLLQGIVEFSFTFATWSWLGWLFCGSVYTLRPAQWGLCEVSGPPGWFPFLRVFSLNVGQIFAPVCAKVIIINNNSGNFTCWKSVCCSLACCCFFSTSPPGENSSITLKFVAWVICFVHRGQREVQCLYQFQLGMRPSLNLFSILRVSI